METSHSILIVEKAEYVAVLGVLVCALNNFIASGSCNALISLLLSFTVPSAPVNISLRQVNRSIVIVLWDIPKHPNGIIDRYLVWYISSQGNIEQVTYIIFVPFISSDTNK